MEYSPWDELTELKRRIISSGPRFLGEPVLLGHAGPGHVIPQVREVGCLEETLEKRPMAVRMHDHHTVGKRKQS